MQGCVKNVVRAAQKKRWTFAPFISSPYSLGGLETSRRPCSQKRRFKGLVHIFTVEGGRESMTVSREECICTHNFACDFCKMFIICLFLAVLSIHCCLGFSLVAANRSYSLAVVYGLLIAVISLVEHQL